MLNTIQQARQKLGIGTTKIYSLIGQGKLPAKKLGRRTFITDEAIQDFITSLADYPSENAEV